MRPRIVKPVSVLELLRLYASRLWHHKPVTSPQTGFLGVGVTGWDNVGVWAGVIFG